MAVYDAYSSDSRRIREKKIVNRSVLALVILAARWLPPPL
jgi:hypothetical protein